MEVIETNIGEKTSFSNLKTTKLFILIVIILGMLYIGKTDYLLFSRTIEFFSIVLSFSIYAICLNSYNKSFGYSIFILGIIYGAIAIFDLLYLAETEKVLNVKGSFSFISTQLWITSRHLQVLSLLLLSAFYQKAFKLKTIISFFLISNIFLILVFITFSIISKDYNEKLFISTSKIQYFVIILTLTLAIFLLIKNRTNYTTVFYRFLLSSSVITLIYAIISIINKEGHIQFNNLVSILKISSFYLAYKTVYEVGINRPFKLLEETSYKLMDKINETLRDNITLNEKNKSNKTIFEELNKCKEILSSIVNFDKNGILVINNDNEILYLNSKIQEIFEIPEYLISKKEDEKILSFIETKFQDSFDFTHYDTFSSNKKEKTPLDNGKTVEQTVYPIKVNDKLIGRLFIFIDITDKKTMEEKIKESERLYRLVVQSSLDGIFIHDGKKIVFANRAGLKILGASKYEDIAQKTVMDFVHPEYYDEVQNRIYSTINNRKSQHLIEEKVIKLDGTVIDVEVLTTPIFYKGKRACLVTLRDITEKKQAEKLKKEIIIKDELLKKEREYSELKNQFFSNISHELKTPLNVILGTLQLMSLLNENNFSFEKMFKYTNIMKQNCYRLIRIVNNFIDMNKINTGYLKIHLQNCNIVSIIEDICLSVAEYIKNKEIDLVFDTDIEEKTIACDIDMIERIMLNLLSNSIKFTDPGGKITISIHDKKEKLLISVKDTGIGIPKDKLDKIFERFNQVETTIKRNKQGSGIGLSLVKSLVEMHEGTIRVESEYGKGAEFIIELPVESIEYNENIYVKEGEEKKDYIEKINIEFSDIYTMFN